MENKLQAQQAKKILIIDDSAEDRETYRRYLLNNTEYKYNILEAELASSGLEECQTQHLDAVLLDYFLPDQDGLEFLESLRSLKIFLHLPVILLTGQGNEVVAVRAMKLGVSDYLIKGQITPKELQTAVNNAIENAQLRAQLRQSEEQLRLALEATNTGTGVWNLQTNSFVCSDLVGPIFGQPPGFCFQNYQAFLDAVYPEDRDRIAGAIANAISSGEKYEVEFRILWGDGSVRWICSQGKVDCDNTGQPQRMFCTVMDITNRKQAELAQQLQIERERIVTQISQGLRESLELNEILNTTVRHVRRFLQTDRTILFQVLPDGQGTVVTESVGTGWPSILSTTIYDPCFVQSYIEPYRQGLVTTITDIYNPGIDPCHQGLLAQFGIRANLVVPILHSDRLWGLLIAHHCSAPREWQHHEIDLLKQLSTQVGIAIQQAELYERVKIELSQRKQAEKEREIMLLRSQQYASQLQGLATASLNMKSALSYEEVIKVITESARLIIGTHRALTNLNPTSDRENALSFCSVSENYALEQRCGIETNSDEPIGGWLGAPLTGRDGRNVGLIKLSDKYQGEFTKEDEAILVQLAQMASKSLENICLFKAEQTSRSQAEAANRVKDEFLAVLSHELRSPLNPILGWAKILQTRQLDRVQIEQGLTAIERNVKLQMRLIDDLLDVARILRGKLALEVAPIDLRYTIEAALETVRTSAKAKSIAIATELFNVGRVSGDADRLQQVVSNLLSNAIKFTNNGGRVLVRLETVDDRAQIVVSDTGFGIDSEFLPNVFEYFRQADASITRKHGGLGLGLAIVRHIVELHGGEVFAASPGIGFGATFTVMLPLLGSGESGVGSGGNATTYHSPLSTPLDGIRVLAVDDDADNCQLIAFILEQYGAEVMAVTKASEAFSAIVEWKPDIFVSDIGMPIEDGYSLLRRIRSLPPSQKGQIPAIALTAYAREEERQQAIAAGFQMHLPKPVDPNILVTAILGLIEKN